MNQTVENYLEEMRTYFAGEKEEMSTDTFVYTDQEMEEDVFLQVSNIKGCYWHIWEDGSGSLKRLDGDNDILICDLISAEYKDAAGCWYGFERTPDWRGELERLVMKGVIRPLDHGSVEFYFYNDIGTESFNQDGKRMFVDMDGTLAEFRTVDTMETLYEKGYFANLPAHENVIDGLKAFMKENPDIEVYILSSVLDDSPYAQNEKEAWIDRYIPEIDANHRIFSPCGSPKCEFVPGGVKEGDILLDDYSKNLHEWSGDAIKLMNGINGTKGSWQGKRIDYQIPAADFAENLLNLCQEKEAHTMRKAEDNIIKAEILSDCYWEKNNIGDYFLKQSATNRTIAIYKPPQNFEDRRGTQYISPEIGNPKRCLEAAIASGYIMPIEGRRPKLLVNESTENLLKNQYFRLNDEWFTFYVNAMDGERKFKLSDEDVELLDKDSLVIQTDEREEDKEAQEIKETLETELFADEKTGVRELSYEEKFNMILEVEFPETSGNYELQQELFEHFMKSPVSGFFDEELRAEFQDIIKENEKQQDSVFDFMENLIQNKKASNFSQETEIEAEVER